MSSITVHAPAGVREPRFAAPAARLFGQFLGWFRRSQAEQAQRQARGARAADARAVRDYASRFARHDPRFAADLMAAADRHEQDA